jgi:hypothetical protein
MDLNNRIESVLSVGFHDTDLNLLAEIYKEVFLQTLDTKCIKCIYNARTELRKFLNKEQVMSKAKYQFKKKYVGVSINDKSICSKPITADTLTDDIAEKLLKNPELKEFIEEIKEEKKAAKE